MSLSAVLLNGSFTFSILSKLSFLPGIWNAKYVRRQNVSFYLLKGDDVSGKRNFKHWALQKSNLSTGTFQIKNNATLSV